MVRILLLSIGLSIIGALHAQHKYTILFDVNKAELSDHERAKLTEICALIGDRSMQRILVNGHADHRGSYAHNQELSERRAYAVYDALLINCGSHVTIELTWHGESRSDTTYLDDRSLAADRKVEVVLIGAATYAEVVHRHAHVEPLIPAGDVPRQHFTIDALGPIEIVADDGVRIRTAPGAIVDRNGDPVDGPIDITYRSFTDPWSIVASGIPMHVGSGSDVQHFESLVMFEVYASKEGEELYLKEGERISLTVPEAVVRDPDFKDWMLDEATGEWTDVSPDRISSPITAAASMSTACQRYLAGVRDLPEIPDTTRLFDRMASDSYCGTELCIPTSKPYSKVRRAYMSPYADNKIPAIQLSMEHSARGSIVFRVHSSGNSAPDWHIFRNRTWTYAGDLSRRDFKRAFVNRHFYQDIILRLDDEDEVTMLLKDRGKWIELPLALHSDPTSTEAQRWHKELVRYKRDFITRRVKFDRRIMDKAKFAIADRERIIGLAWREARTYMNAEELALTMEEFQEHAQRSQQALWQNVALATNDGMTQSFAMNGFGIYNCDRIIRFEMVRPEIVEVRDQDEKRFAWTKAYAVFDGDRSVITYWGNGSGRDAGLILSRKIDRMLFVSSDGDLLMVEQPLKNSSGDRRIFIGERLGNRSEVALDALAANP